MRDWRVWGGEGDRVHWVWFWDQLRGTGWYRVGVLSVMLDYLIPLLASAHLPSI